MRKVLRSHPELKDVFEGTLRLYTIGNIEGPLIRHQRELAKIRLKAMGVSTADVINLTKPGGTYAPKGMDPSDINVAFVNDVNVELFEQFSTLQEFLLGTVTGDAEATLKALPATEAPDFMLRLDTYA